MAMGWRQGRWAGGLVRGWEVGEANWEVCNPSTVASPRGLRLNICGLQGALPATFCNTPIRTAPVEHARRQVFTTSDCSITSRCADLSSRPNCSDLGQTRCRPFCPCLVKDAQGYLNDVHGNVIGVHRCPWISIDIFGDPRLFTSICGYAWISVDIHAYP